MVNMVNTPNATPTKPPADKTQTLLCVDSI